MLWSNAYAIANCLYSKLDENTKRIKLCILAERLNWHELSFTQASASDKLLIINQRQRQNQDLQLA